MRVVLDTSVFIAALLGRESGSARKTVEAVLKGEVVPLMGEALFNEYLEVMNRDQLMSLCPLDEGERAEFLAAFIQCCRWTKIHFRWRPNLRDEGDNHIIELAVAGRASWIITNNIKDLKSGELFFQGLEVVTPEQFIKESLWE